MPRDVPADAICALWPIAARSVLLSGPMAAANMPSANCNEWKLHAALLFAVSVSLNAAHGLYLTVHILYDNYRSSLPELIRACGR